MEFSRYKNRQDPPLKSASWISSYQEIVYQVAQQGKCSQNNIRYQSAPRCGMKKKTPKREWTKKNTPAHNFLALFETNV